MKKLIFLWLILIISSVNIYAIHKAKRQEKVKESFHHQYSKVKLPGSLTTEIFTRYSAFRLACEVK
jgi:hypothetical protein